MNVQWDPTQIKPQVLSHSYFYSLCLHFEHQRKYLHQIYGFQFLNFYCQLFTDLSEFDPFFKDVFLSVVLRIRMYCLSASTHDQD